MQEYKDGKKNVPDTDRTNEQNTKIMDTEEKDKAQRDYADAAEQVARKFDKRKIWSLLGEYAIYIGIFVLIVFVFPKVIAGKTLVDGHSMENTLQNGDILVHEMLSYYRHEPERYDIVRIKSPIVEGEYWVKRIIGLPGETVQIKNGKIFIDGKVLKDDVYGSCEIEDPGMVAEPYTVPEGFYFLVGDNRAGFDGEMSWDSRYEDVGPIPREDILAKIVFRIWPISHIGKIK